MVIPVGARYDQELHLIIRHRKDNEVINLGGCRFVSLIGKEAWAD
jgi:protein-L-isoaspartate O-methyltransferase